MTYPKVSGTLIRNTKADLLKLARRFVPSNVSANILIVQGLAREVISHATKQKHIDLIVLTTHGRSECAARLLSCVCRPTPQLVVSLRAAWEVAQ